MAPQASLGQTSYQAHPLGRYKDKHTRIKMICSHVFMFSFDKYTYTKTGIAHAQGKIANCNRELPGV